MPRVLLFASTTGYQIQGFQQAARELGAELVHATDRCEQLDDPWRDGAIRVAFDQPARAAAHLIDVLNGAAVDGILAVGDRPARLAACVAEELGLFWHTAAGVAAAYDKREARSRVQAAGLSAPWFASWDLNQEHSADGTACDVQFPCVVKPAILSASRGVMRADTPHELDRALDRLRRLFRSPDLVGLGERALGPVLIEGFIPGREFALEGVMDRGSLRVLAIFEKPHSLDGPFFEETLYVTPPLVGEPTQRAITEAMARAATVLGLRHGPIHAECRVNDQGVFVLEVAARPIGGLCGRALRFVTPSGTALTLEGLLLRHAINESLASYTREEQAAGVMMIPVPGRGRFRGVQGLDDARRVPGIEDIVLTTKPGQLLEPWPEGHSYPGFIFARAPQPGQVEAALSQAHALLRFELDSILPLA